MKVTGSYASVVRGVSQQVPQDRFPGQHNEQVNLVSDPVRGLARRHGSILFGERKLSDTTADYEARVSRSARMKVITTVSGGREYDLIFRTNADAAGNRDDFLHVFDKVDKKFLDVVYPESSPTIDSLVSGGVSAALGVGRYVFMAGHTVSPTFTPTDELKGTGQRAVAWVRSGAYSRTYRVTVTVRRKSDDALIRTFSGADTTMPSSYQGTLDTSSCVVGTDYQKCVNDKVYAYNSAVTQHIGLASQNIQPQNIASRLATSLQANGAGVEGASFSVVNSTVVMGCSDEYYFEVQVNDGGDGTGLRGVGMVVTAAELVSTIHYPGKVVKVQPKKNDGTDAYYLKAVAINGTTSNWTEVRWVEAAGYTMQPTVVFPIGTFEDGKFYLGGTPQELDALVPGGHPTFQPNRAGDDISAVRPFFFGKRITHLSMFQDRLVIASGAVLFFSKPGDYFNWFRPSLLVESDDDPIELYALGSEDDVISASTTYDRSLVLFGRRKQYIVSGRSILTPKTASVVTMSAHEDATDADAVNSGNLLFYTKFRNNKVSAHQIQIGLVQDSPESFEISRPLDTYMKGRPVQILALTSPNTVLIRTETERRRLFVYNYLDTPASQERLFDSWSSWRWAEKCGCLLAVSSHDGDLLLYWLRKGKDSDGTEGTWVIADLQPLDTEVSDYPYLDSLRHWPVDRALTTGRWRPLDEANMSLAIDNRDGDAKLLGVPLTRADELVEQYPEQVGRMWVGMDYHDDTLVSPTNPYMRDRNDKVITTGRLTLARALVTVADTGGMRGFISTTNGDKQVTDFSGRVLGRATNVVGHQPVVDTTVPVPVGREVRAVEYTLMARKWLPLTITAIEWVGQYFSSTRRV